VSNADDDERENGSLYKADVVPEGIHRRHWIFVIGPIGGFALRKPLAAYVSCGSLADIAAAVLHVRSTPESRYHRNQSSYPLSTNNRHLIDAKLSALKLLSRYCLETPSAALRAASEGRFSSAGRELSTTQRDRQFVEPAGKTE